MEMIKVVRRDPGWRCPVEVVIDATVEEAVERKRHNEADV